MFGLSAFQGLGFDGVGPPKSRYTCFGYLYDTLHSLDLRGTCSCSRELWVGYGDGRHGKFE